MTLHSSLHFRVATAADLPAINRLVTSAVMNWPMADRVKRLSLSTLTYDEVDMSHFDVILCERVDEIIGVAVWDPTHCANDVGQTGLLHGLYVLPIAQRQGVGRELMNEVFTAAATRGLGGILLRAQRVTKSFFEQNELAQMPEGDGEEYPHRFYKDLSSAA